MPRLIDADDLICKSELRKTFAELCPGNCGSCNYSSATDGKLYCAMEGGKDNDCE